MLQSMQSKDMKTITKLKVSKQLLLSGVKDVLMKNDRVGMPKLTSHNT